MPDNNAAVPGSSGRAHGYATAVDAAMDVVAFANHGTPYPRTAMDAIRELNPHIANPVYSAAETLAAEVLRLREEVCRLTAGIQSLDDGPCSCDWRERMVASLLKSQ